MLCQRIFYPLCKYRSNGVEQLVNCDIGAIVLRGQQCCCSVRRLIARVHHLLCVCVSPCVCTHANESVPFAKLSRVHECVRRCRKVKSVCSVYKKQFVKSGANERSINIVIVLTHTYVHVQSRYASSSVVKTRPKRRAYSRRKEQTNLQTPRRYNECQQ